MSSRRRGVPYAITHHAGATSHVRPRRFVDVVDDRREDAGIARRVHAVAEVEDVSRVAGVVGEHGVGPGEGDVGAGEHERRIEVALDGDVVTEALAGGRRSACASRGRSPAARPPPSTPGGGRSRCRSGSRGRPGWRSASSANTRREWGSTNRS